MKSAVRPNDRLEAKIVLVKNTTEILAKIIYIIFTGPVTYPQTGTGDEKAFAGTLL
jgi:hypothetical protein